MSVEQQIAELTRNLQALVTSNQTLAEQVKDLAKENREMKEKDLAKEELLKQKKTEWLTLNTSAGEMLVQMKALRVDVEKAGGTGDYLKETLVFRDEGAFEGLWDLMPEGVAEQAELKTQIKGEAEDAGEIENSQDPFVNTGREEKLDISFGIDCTGKALRRFMDKYKVVKQLNVAARLTGWDNPEYRANKLKLALQGEAFDYVSFESTMPNKTWTVNDEEILVKLQDRYLKIQAIELHILEFERCAQGPKEPLSEFLSRIQRLAADAYDGDSDTELERKLAWRFVTGIRSDSIRQKLMEFGWMKTRREAKSLEELLKVAEMAKMTEEAVRSTGPERNSVSVVQQEEVDTVNAARFERRKTQSSDSSKSAGSKSSTGGSDDFFECHYCHKKHKGGWRRCALRREQDPDWRPKRTDAPRTKKDF